MNKVEEQYKLSPMVIDEVSAKATEVFNSLKMKSDAQSRVRLSIEESLLVWLDSFGEGQEITFEADKLLFRPTIIIKCKSDAQVNPYKDEKVGAFTKLMLNNLMVAPEYSYDDGENILTYKLKKPERNPLITSVLVIIFSVIFGIVGLKLIPSDALAFILDKILNPIYDKFLDVLRCIAGPLIFFSVAWGIYGIGDTATLSKLGKNMMLKMVGATFMAAICCIPLFWVFNSQLTGESANYTQIFDLFQMFLDVIPSTIVEPFSTGNTLQIIVLSIVVGLALLFLGKRTKSVAMVVEQINLIVNFIMSFISKIVPYFIAIVLISFIWSGSISILSDSWQLVLLLIGVIVIEFIVFILFTCIKQKVKPQILLKKSVETYFIALTTASSAASFSTMVKTCEQRFGISKFLTGFGIPLGVIMQKVSTVVNNVLIVFFLANIYQVDCSISWIIMTVIVATIMAVSTPPIPGGGAIAYTMLFMQMGIPLEGLAIALAMDMIIDFLVTSADMVCVQFTLINVADKFNMIDKEILRKNN